MTVRRLVRKRCATCGTVDRYRAREVKCKRRKFGPRSYCCWGQLTPVMIVRKPRVTLKDRIATMAVDGEIEASQLTADGAAFRAVAAKKLARVQNKYAVLGRQAQALRKRIELLRRERVRLARESTMTDVEIAAAQFRMARKLFVGSAAAATDRGAE